MAEAPRIFRVVLQVSDLDKAAVFYATLLGAEGRRVHGARHYFDCGGVILALLDPALGNEMPTPSPDYTYFAVKDLDAAHARARELECLSEEEIHGANAGDIVTRPWGERSFYADDPFGNGLCFVDDSTIYTGR